MDAKNAVSLFFGALFLVTFSLLCCAAYIPEGMSSTVTQFCNDSDGTNFYVKGTVEDADGVWTDHCSANFLIEYLCDDDYHTKIGRGCENGCTDGACNNPPMDDEPAEEELESSDSEEHSPEQAEEESEEEITEQETEPNEPDVSEDVLEEEVVNETEYYVTDILLLLPEHSNFSANDESTSKVGTSSSKNLVSLKDTDPYEMTDSELRYFAEQLATYFGEDINETLNRTGHLKEEGRLYEEIERLKKEYPLKARIYLMQIQTKDPELQETIEKISPVSPDILDTKTEILQQSISFNTPFSSSESGTYTYLKSTKEGPKLNLPQFINVTELIAEPIVFNITEDEGNRELMAQLEIIADEDGNITSARLMTFGDRVLVKTSKNRLVNIKSAVELNLMNFTKDSGLQLITYSTPDKALAERFEKAAARQKLKLVERAGVVQIEKFNLKNKEDISSAKIIFKLEGNLLGRKKPESIYVLRASGNITELLPTRFKGTDDDGYMIFEAESERGLSAFALFITEPVSLSYIPSTATMIKIMFVIIVIGIGVFIVLYSVKQKRKKK
ncbi:MAG: hypothetical protein KJ574_02440 [Nanoarchaeota archaeon]|nr:hypothetical protein [Nanoarchaeota archaeon]